MPPSFLWDTLKRNINKLFFAASLNIFVSQGPRTVGQDHQKVKKPHIRPRKEEKQLDTSGPLVDKQQKMGEHAHPFFVVNPLKGQKYQAVFLLSLF